MGVACAALAVAPRLPRRSCCARGPAARGHRRAEAPSSRGAEAHDSNDLESVRHISSKEMKQRSAIGTRDLGQQRQLGHIVQRDGSAPRGAPGGGGTERGSRLM